MAFILQVKIGWRRSRDGGGTVQSRELRDLLRKVMEKEGFTVLNAEWWHFDYNDWNSYGILDVPFEGTRDHN